MFKKLITNLTTPTIEPRPQTVDKTKVIRTVVQGAIIAEVLGGTFAEKAVYTAYPLVISAAATAGAYSVKDEFKN
jgi:hypothetical protein